MLIKNTLDLNTNKIINVRAPTAATDASTKGYVDAIATGLKIKDSVRAATTAVLPAGTYANGTAGVGATFTETATDGALVIDGITIALNDRILVKNQVAGLQNGIYALTTVGVAATTSFVLTRVTDCDNEILAGLFTFVEEGTVNVSRGYVLSTANPITVGTTALVFAQFSKNPDIIAGSGLSFTGVTLNVDATIPRLYVDTPASSASSYAIAHNLGKTSVSTTVFDVATGAVIYPDFTITDSNTVTLTFGSAQSASSFRVLVLG